MTTTPTVTYEIPSIDDDGFALVLILEAGEEIARHRIRCDIADQWAYQEVAIINDRRAIEALQEAAWLAEANGGAK